MPYEVRYTTDQYPTDLPEGAEVTKVSALPYRFNAGGATPTEVEVAACSEEGIVVNIWARDEIDDQATIVSLSAAQARRLREALTEALGETAPPPSDAEHHTARRLIDGDDSVWFELSPGLWTLDSKLEQAKDNRAALLAFGHNLADNYADWSLGRIEAMYGIEVGPHAIQ